MVPTASLCALPSKGEGMLKLAIAGDRRPDVSREADDLERLAAAARAPSDRPEMERQFR
jgi:hypothetical protein